MKQVPCDITRGVLVEACAKTEWEDSECVRSVRMHVVTTWPGEEERWSRMKEGGVEIIRSKDLWTSTLARPEK